MCVQPGSGNQTKYSRQEIVNVVDYTLSNNKIRIVGTETNEYEADLQDLDYEMMATIYYVSKTTAPGFSGGHATDLNRYLIQNMFNQLWSSKKEYFHLRMGQGGVHNGYNYWSSDFERKVKELAAQIKNYKPLTKNTTNKQVGYISKEGEIILGPFSIDYDGKNIESVKIGNIIGNSNNTSTILWANSSTSDTWKEIKYIGNIKNWKEQEPLSQNKEFYLKVKGNLDQIKGQDGKIKVTITQEGREVTRARMLTTVSVRTGKSTTGQGLAIYAADGEEGVNIEYTIGTSSTPPSTPPVTPPPSTSDKVSISGYVWVDKTKKGDVAQTENGTIEVTDSLYKAGTNDVKLSGVTVKLYKNGAQVGNAQTTDNDGNYKFDGNTYNISKNELNSYHIEFDYSGLSIDGASGKKYIPVAYDVKDSSGNTLSNASRALMSSIPESDSELSGKATTYTGTNNLAYSFGTFAGNSVLFANNELRYINLGIKEIYEPDYELVEDLKYVKIVMNNHQYVYEYGAKQLPNIAAAPQVSFQSPSVNSYQRAVYPSALYDLKEGRNTNGQMKVYC